ncbi:hypothetical protein GKZ89_05265 [Bacillus mangrovi]|uniref:Uncharacterized protein n=1 Tax=Metabacillus mangrovi TaxID=1491830 RepID=A0A7X2S3Z2_9BACI|nr:hypothetical protein [Metabacillus mangrovi]MTH52811.1 hypothetical protein [Metabacillus mangrovi]
MTAVLTIGGIAGTVLSIVFSRIFYKKKLKKDQQGLLVLWSLLSLLLPVIGFLFGWLMVRRFRSRSDDAFMSGYSSYITNKVYNFENLRASLAEDRRLLNAGSHSTENAWVMKNLLLHMSNEENNHHEILIKKGLNHPDKEAVHYAATITNVLQDRLTERIRDLNKKKAPEHPEVYIQLMAAYEEFLSSELISSGIREMAEYEYEALLREAEALYKENHVYTESLGLFLFEKNREEGERILSRLFDKNPDSSKVLWGWLQVSYKNGHWKAVFELAGKLGDHRDFQTFPDKQQEIIQYLGGSRR